MKRINFISIICVLIMFYVSPANSIDINTLIRQGISSENMEEILVKSSIYTNAVVNETILKRLEWPNAHLSYETESKSLEISSSFRIDGAKFFRGDFGEIDRKIAQTELIDAKESAISQMLTQYFAGLYYEKIIQCFTDVIMYEKDPFAREEVLIQIAKYKDELYLLKNDIGWLTNIPEKDITFSDLFIEVSQFDNMTLNEFITKWRDEIPKIPELQRRKLEWLREDLEAKEENLSKFPSVTLQAEQRFGEGECEFEVSANLDYSYKFFEFLSANFTLDSDFKSPINGRVTLSTVSSLQHGHVNTVRTYHDYEQKIQEDFLSLINSYKMLQLAEKRYFDFMKEVWTVQNLKEKQYMAKFTLEMSLITSKFTYSQNVTRLYDSLGLLYFNWEQEGNINWLFGD